MKIRLKITEDHIRLIKALRPQRFGETKVGIDRFGLYGGTYIYEDMAYILDLQDKVIPETLESPMGAQYEKEAQERMDLLADDMERHLVDYEDILHQFCDKGGIRPGTYTCNDNVRLWSFLEHK